MSGQTSRWRGVIALAFLVLLFACGQDDTAKKPNKEAELIEAETALIVRPGAGRARTGKASDAKGAGRWWAYIG
jgi:hypothetical protein